jgi:hypothetical protein
MKIIDNCSSINLRILITRDKIKQMGKPWDEEWEMWGQVSMPFTFSRTTEIVSNSIEDVRKGASLHQGKDTPVSSARFAEFLRAIADEIDCFADLEEDAEAEFEERAAIIEHDGNLSREQAEERATAETGQ